MQKFVKISGLVFVAAWALAPITAVQAADGDTQTSTATFSATAGTLTLDKVPNLNFGSVGVADLMQGDTPLTLQSGDTSASGSSGDGSSDRQIQVTDTRGSNTGWQLTAQLGSFTLVGDTSVSLNAQSLLLSNVSTSTTGAGANTFNTGASLSYGPMVWSADSSNPGTGTNTTTIAVGGATLMLAKTTNVRSGTYDAPITWQLTAGPEN